MIVDGAAVDKLAAWIDDEHVWSGFGAVKSADVSGGIQNHGAWDGLHFLQIGILLRRADVSLSSWRRRYNRQPHHPFGRPLALQRFHVPTLIMFAGIGT